MTFPINIPKNHYKWGDYDGNVFEKNHTRNIWHHCLLEEKLIHASHMSSRERLDEITQLLNTWIQDSAMKYITFQAIMVMSSLMLQKPSRKSKVKDHSEALRWRMILW